MSLSGVRTAMPPCGRGGGAGFGAACTSAICGVSLLPHAVFGGGGGCGGGVRSCVTPTPGPCPSLNSASKDAWRERGERFAAMTRLGWQHVGVVLAAGKQAAVEQPPGHLRRPMLQHLFAQLPQFVRLGLERVLDVEGSINPLTSRLIGLTLSSLLLSTLSFSLSSAAAGASRGALQAAGCDGRHGFSHRRRSNGSGQRSASGRTAAARRGKQTKTSLTSAAYCRRGSGRLSLGRQAPGPAVVAF